jgi:hypothetical protein
MSNSLLPFNHRKAQHVHLQKRLFSRPDIKLKNDPGEPKALRASPVFASGFYLLIYHANPYFARLLIYNYFYFTTYSSPIKFDSLVQTHVGFSKNTIRDFQHRSP